jgi:hypothetical protein
VATTEKVAEPPDWISWFMGCVVISAGSMRKTTKLDVVTPPSEVMVTHTWAFG